MGTTSLQTMAARVVFAVSRFAAVISPRRIHVNLAMVEGVVIHESQFLMARKLLRFMPGLGALAGRSAGYPCRG